MCPTCTLVLIDTFVQLIHCRASGVIELTVIEAEKKDRQEILPTFSSCSWIKDELRKELDE
jgi:hypothetical protein